MTAETPTIVTIGVYGSTEESFFGALVDYEIELFIDIRARRGMRGSKYSYVNSSALQTKLKDLGIYYAHLKELAPTKEIRALQWQADKEENTKKRDRKDLSAAYVEAYKKQILKYGKRKAELILEPQKMLERAKQLAEFPTDLPLQRYVLFCVEADAKACHRSLVAARFRNKIIGKVKHL
ncbi:MAG: DUF488 domain-containing protein [Anaerolineae bacterium]|nr:DUF488 domain-containing protein [Anaerolineae bacterium]